jgi:hypothetical protein
MGAELSRGRQSATRLSSDELARHAAADDALLTRVDALNDVNAILHTHFASLENDVGAWSRDYNQVRSAQKVLFIPCTVTLCAECYRFFVFFFPVRFQVG